MPKLQLAIVEYGSDYGDVEPALILAVDENAMATALLAVFKGFTYEGNDGEDYERDHPIADVTPDTFGAWYVEYHEYSTSPWITRHEYDTDDLAGTGYKIF